MVEGVIINVVSSSVFTLDDSDFSGSGTVDGEYSLAGVTPYFEAHGFRVSALPGRSFGFFVEFEPSESPEFDARLYHPVPENLSLLQRNGLLHQASFEAARSYYYQAAYMVRTQWALSLDEKLRGDARAPSR